MKGPRPEAPAGAPEAPPATAGPKGKASGAQYRKAKLSPYDRKVRRELHMRTTIRALDKVKRVTGSDQVTAQILSIEASKLSAVRKLRQPLPPAQAVKLAHMVEEPLFPALALALSATARSDETRNFWLDLATGRWP